MSKGGDRGANEDAFDEEAQLISLKGETSSVWRRVEDLLPKEVTKLIVEDDSF